MSYAREDRTLGEELGKHLKLMQRQGLIAPWTLHEIEAGTDRDDAVAQGLKTANIILLLISASYLGSDFCWEREMSRALERHQSRQASVVPVLVRPCDWESAPFGKLQVLPRNARPVRSDAWKTEDDAWVEITRDIRSLVQRVLAPV